MAVIWCMVPDIWSVTDKIFCHFGSLLAFLPPNNPKKQNFEKMKKTPGHIIILHKCNVNDNHIMHGSWDAERDIQTFLSFWTIICPFTPLATWKIKILKKLKKIPGDIIIFHMCTINDNHVTYSSWDIECDGQNFLLFWIIFCPFTPMTTQIN